MLLSALSRHLSASAKLQLAFTLLCGGLFKKVFDFIYFFVA
jgi:hypothetical protein